MPYQTTIHIYRIKVKILITFLAIVAMLFPTLLMDVSASSSNNLLSEVTFSTGSLNYDFTPSRIYYNLTLPMNTSEVEVNVTPQDGSAKYSVAGHTNINQSSSTGKIVVTVTAANGNRKWYTFAIQFSGTSATTTKSTTSSTTTKANGLSAIQFGIGALNIPFDSSTTEYTLTLPKETNSVEVIALPATLANVKVSGNNPLDLDNPEIVVTTPTQTYRFAVVFEDTPGGIPTDTTNSINFGLEFLEIKDYTLNKTFQSNVYEYQVVVNRASEKFEVKAIATDEEAMIEIDQDRNRIKIVVSTDEKRATYVVRLLEKGSATNRNLMANVFQDLLIAIVLLTLAVLLFILSRKVKKERIRSVDDDE